MIADIEELEEMDASEIHARRLDAKEVLTPMKGDNFIPSRRWNSQTSGINRRLKPSTLIKDRPERGEEQEFFRGESDEPLLQRLFKMTQHAMMRKLKVISGPCWEISFIATTLNPESNCTCRKKN